MNTSVMDLEIYEDNLIASGTFTIAGGVPAKWLATWNGSEWQPFSVEVNSSVYSLGIFNNSLIVGGVFPKSWL